MENKIRSRKRNRSTEKEYYITFYNTFGSLVYHGWYTAKEICRWPECDSTVTAMKAKILKFNNGGFRFTSHYSLITHTREANKNCYVRKISLMDNPEWREFVNLLTSWPHGSMLHKTKIIQGKYY